MVFHFEHFIGGLAAVFIGVSKAGFGGGLGILTTPLCVLAFGAQNAIGILLPLLCAGDAFSLYHYWCRWRVDNLWFLLPGVLIGVIVGVQLLGRFSSRELNLVIGILAIGFVIFNVTKDRLFRQHSAFKPSHTTGVPCGIGAGLTSTFAHGAGPVVTLFLLPQNMPKEVYVGTTVLVFTCINWIKFPFFIYGGLITNSSIMRSLLYLPLIPVGVWLGVWLNRRISDKIFRPIVYGLTFLAGAELIWSFIKGH
jgi:uncharacterized membrane protein YfcA